MSRITNLLKRYMFQNETINDNYVAKFIDVSETALSYVIQFDYRNGSGDVDIILAVEASADGVSFAPFTENTVNITDDLGTIIFDVAGSGAEFVRLAIEHTAGSFDADCLVIGKKFH